jgi:hypothetical protein
VSFEDSGQLCFVSFSINFTNQRPNEVPMSPEDIPLSWFRFSLTSPESICRGDRGVVIQFNNTSTTTETTPLVENSRKNVQGTAYLQVPDEYEGLSCSSNTLPFPSTAINILPRLINDELWFFADFSRWMEDYWNDI